MLKLSKAHRELLADVRDGCVWRSGTWRAPVATVVRPGTRARDVTVLVEALHREFLVVPGRAVSANVREARPYRLTEAGERLVAPA